MHAPSPLDPAPNDLSAGPWYKELTRYHWFVLIVAALGWLFDTMDQQLFTLARAPAMKELLATASGPPSNEMVAEYSGYATAIFLMGWASGGLFFGVLGDRIGRARTMLLTILIYSACTGLSALSVGFWDFAFYRFLTGLGVGGEFAVGVALVAEVMPDRARPYALAWLQALSAVGNISAALINFALTREGITGLFGGVSYWRIMFIVGTLPALLVVVIRRRLKEPERWQAVAVEEGVQKQLGSYRELFSNPRWARNAVVGLALAFAGVVGLWSIGFFFYDLVRLIFRDGLVAQGLTESEVSAKLGEYTSLTSLLFNVGAFFGIHLYMQLTRATNRRTAFFICHLLALGSTAFALLYLGRFNGFVDAFWIIPILGLCQLSLFGGYAIYFPELFPTRLRSTGTSFCYNVGRFVAAIGPYMLGMLTSRVFNFYPPDQPDMPMRMAGLTMCAVFLVGLIALPFAPETKGKPLPE
jgi:MFS family permease